MNFPSITVIIVNYHLADFTIRAALSVFKQNMRSDLVDIWIVDNSESVEQVKKLQSKLSSFCNFFIAEKNVGFGEACNIIYRKTRSPYIFLLNPDAYCLPDALPLMLQCLESYPLAAAVGPKIYWDDEKQCLLPPSWTPNRWETILQTPKGFLTQQLTWAYSLKHRRAALECWQATSPVLQPNLSGGHILLRRAMVEKAGGLFDPKFFMYYEDTDLCLRLRKGGFKLYVEPRAQVVHKFGSCVPEKAEWKNSLAQTSHHYFMSKHYHYKWFENWIINLHQNNKKNIWQPQQIYLGKLDESPILNIPTHWQEKWLLELSPSPYFIPAAGILGSGSEVNISLSLWSLIKNQPLFLRLSPVKKRYFLPKLWSWS